MKNARMIPQLLALFGSVFISLTVSAIPSRPKLVLVLVYDQFRSDYLTRFEKDFLPPQKNNQLGGFRYLMEKGAYFPMAEYDILQSMTCPGHAMILTGSYPRNNGIPLNSWFDRKTQKSIYCAEDADFGFSPKNLLGSTVGDELKLISPKSRVFGLALKDRSAIMLAGHGADGAFWFDKDAHIWTTSGYYPKPPAWLEEFNKKISEQKDKKYVWVPKHTKHNFKHEEKRTTNNGLSTPYGGVLTSEFAKKLIKEFKLGQRNETDLLAVSFSTHDLAGHRFGATSPEMEEMTLSEDAQLSELLNELNRTLIGGLNSVLIVMTADHGVAPSNEESARVKLDHGELDNEKLKDQVNSFLKEKNKLTAGVDLVIATDYLNFYLNTDHLLQLKLNEVEVKSQIKNYLLEQAGVQSVIVSSEMESSKGSVLLMDQQALRTIQPKKNGDLVLVPKPFWFEHSKHKTTHMTGYSYDRYVPVILLGSSVKAARYPQSVRVVDIAPTLSYLLGQTPPALSEGVLLKDALQH